MCVHVHLLVIAIASCVWKPYLFFHIYAHYFVTVSETKCLSYVCTNVGSIDVLQ